MKRKVRRCVPTPSKNFKGQVIYRRDINFKGDLLTLRGELRRIFVNLPISCPRRKEPFKCKQHRMHDTGRDLTSHPTVGDLVVSLE